ncbi:unnamed protein product [Boreogadus saida]
MNGVCGFSCHGDQSLAKLLSKYLRMHIFSGAICTALYRKVGTEDFGRHNYWWFYYIFNIQSSNKVYKCSASSDYRSIFKKGLWGENRDYRLIWHW